MINVKTISVTGYEHRIQVDEFFAIQSPDYFLYRKGDKTGFIPKKGFIVEWDDIVGEK